MIKIQQIYDEVILYLTENLDPKLVYHNVNHTRYVFEKTEAIASKEGVSGDDLYLIQTAALFHDIGFVKTHSNHEEVGCQIADKWLKNYGFSNSERLKIHGMIMATKIPQEPKNILESILADADLIYLGTPVFQKISSKLFKELSNFNDDLSPEIWSNIQISFMKSHHYHTKYCKRYYEYRKQRRLKSLIELHNQSFL